MYTSGVIANVQVYLSIHLYLVTLQMIIESLGKTWKLNRQISCQEVMNYVSLRQTVTP